ncbi:alpha/beta fold hydrolase [Amycolatopsis azurea]|uniref:Alpha/beta hydrolase n=1 Tax=Amycolatopsis azurea DSM 43854 TaxID=1238180 RepID=M2P468_9PSEU|nr:alpha/beta hydrolase [Amycolatopsis azurea]EMD29989.1 carboxylesterase [Amycolatopsis azurea DSM 43854]OOC04765.1 alpha/beta hydrolase [Amycolatopsis azurea DSM 43854]
MKLGGFASSEARAEYEAVYERGLAALPAPTGTHDIRTEFGVARVYRFGRPGGTPIVLLPGRAGTVVMWEPNLKALIGHGEVYAVDLIGEAGRSEQTVPIRDGADQAAWLTTVLAELDLPSVHLVGYSFGGWLAANLAVRAPERLKSLTVIDPVLTFGGLTAGLVVRATLTAVPVVNRWARPSFLRWISGDAEVDATDPVARVIDEGMRTYRIALPSPRLFTDAQLRSLRMPVLALIAGRSVIHHPERAAARARKLLPQGQVELWPSATHAIAGEAADEVNTRILTFLSECDAAGKTPS